MTRVLVLVCFPVIAGCCSWAAGHCPKPVPVPQLVEVLKPCKLPPPIELPEVVPVACPLPLTCFDVQGAKGLADRESKMKTWIKEAKAACGTLASRP
jgi:hypothetical protein